MIKAVRRGDRSLPDGSDSPGADDEQIPPGNARKRFDACGSKDKTFRVFTAEKGGAQHCQRDYLTLVAAEMWNWFEDKLVRA